MSGETYVPEVHYVANLIFERDEAVAALADAERRIDAVRALCAPVAPLGWQGVVRADHVLAATLDPEVSP